MVKLVIVVFLLTYFSFLFADPVKDKIEKMTIEEKIGQLFVIPACPNRMDIQHKEDLHRMITKYHVGSVILKQGNPTQYHRTMLELQSYAKDPLFFMVDAEWGLGMRISETISFPKNLTLGAIQDNVWINLLGQEIGRECRALGVHINLAPVVDINSNPKNPIISMRSFGENRENVATKSVAFMKGMQDRGILACAKHFPGHGNTEQDSHLSLPILNVSPEHLNQVELYPFRQVIKENIGCVMSAHLLIPALSELPATLSPDILTKLLINDLQFEGLVISDALNMKGLTSSYSTQTIAFLAFKAGNDLLLYGDHIAPNIDQLLSLDIPLAFDTIKQACLSEEIHEDELNQHVYKILKAKECILLPPTGEPLITQKALDLKNKLYQLAITLIKDNQVLLPLKSEITYALIADENTVFEKHLRLMTNIDWYPLSTDIEKLDHYSAILVSLDKPHPDHFKGNDKTILVYFGNPYELNNFHDYGTEIAAYENDSVAQEVSAQLLVGKYPFSGKLPIKKPF